MKPATGLVVGTVVMHLADFNCTCCAGKYVHEEVIYESGDRRTIHAWKIVDSEDERVDRIVQLEGLDGPELRLRQVF